LLDLKLNKSPLSEGHPTVSVKKRQKINGNYKYHKKQFEPAFFSDFFQKNSLKYRRYSAEPGKIFYKQ